MKFFNKKKVERSKWVTAPAPKISSVPDAKTWCKQQPGDKRFYFHYTNTKWWFEDSADALAFSLTWSGR